MLRGTRVITDNEAKIYSQTIEDFRQYMIGKGYSEVIVPSIWEQETFVKKAGEEVLGQMYAFQDKKGRPICLIPEVTAIIQELYKASWAKSKPKPVKVFYVSRCYRYERPQDGRYREFCQLGVELLGGKNPDDKAELFDLLTGMMKNFQIREYNINPFVKRGLDYYVEDGFEVEIPILGAQKQVLGGGRYDCGIGFAFGLDRILLAKKMQDEKEKV